MKKLKKYLCSLREDKLSKRYLIMGIINIVFYSLMTLPTFFSYSDVAADFVRLGIRLALLLFSLLYGFLSVEITDNIFYANIAYLIIGGIWAGFFANDLMQITDLGGASCLFYCIWHFLRYGVVAFFISLVIKNTR